MTNEPDVPPENLVEVNEGDAVDEGDDAASPHDAWFYKTFSKPEHAAAELKCIFQPALVARIDWDTLNPLPIKFVDTKLSCRRLSCI